MFESKAMKIFLAIASIFTSIPSIAQTSFLGIALGTPFPGEMPECPKSKLINNVDFETIKEAGACYFSKQPNKFTVYNGPNLEIGHLLVVETDGGKPVSFSFQFNKEKYSHAVDIFTIRYGKPQKVDRQKGYTYAGDSLTSRVTIWDGNILKIKLDEVGKDIHWTEALIINVPVANEIARRNKEAAAIAASNL